MLRATPLLVLAACATAAAEPADDDDAPRGALGTAPVVILGNSKVGTDLDLGDVAAALGPGAPALARLGVGGSHGPVWYTMLADRVYSTDWRPNTVLVYGPLSHALDVNLDVPALTQLLRRVTHEVPPALYPLYGGPPGPAWRQETSLQPGCPGERPAAPTLDRAPLSADPAESYLAAIARLAGEHGARTVFVRQPVAPGGTLVDDTPLDVENAARAALSGLGAAWLDLRDPDLAHPHWYGDAVHMTEAGRHHLSAAFGAALAPILAAPFAPVPPAVAPPSPVRSGEPFAPITGFVAENAGPDACGALLDLPPALAGLDDASLLRAGLGVPSPFRVMLGDRPARHAEVGERPDRAACDGRWLTEAGPNGVRVRVRGRPAVAKKLSLVPLADAVAEGPGGERSGWVAPGGGFELGGTPKKVEVTVWAPAAGSLTVNGKKQALVAGMQTFTARTDGALRLTATGWVAVRRVGVPGEEPAFDVGPRVFDLLAGTYRVGPAPALPAAPAPVLGKKSWTKTVDLQPVTLGGLAVPLDGAAGVAAGPGLCSPLRPELPEGWRWSAVGHTLTVERLDCTAMTPDPVPLALAEDRACRREGTTRWLYPGDHARFVLDADATGIPLGLDLWGGVLEGGDPKANLHLRVLAGDAVLLDTEVPVAALRAGLAPLPLTGAPGPLTLELATPPEAPFVLVTGARLEERR